MNDDELQFEIAEIRKDWTHNYVTSIGDAWELVEEMREDETVEVYIFANRADVKISIFEVSWEGESDSHRLGLLAEAQAATAPRAICEAWLAWAKARKGGRQG